MSPKISISIKKIDNQKETFYRVDVNLNEIKYIEQSKKADVKD